MAYTTIDKPTDYFETLLYTGNGAANRDISGLDFQPDWVWIKARSDTTWHHVFDSTRGANKPVNTNVDNAEGSVTTFPAFNSDGFRVNAGNLNTDSQTNVAWCWKANAGTTTSDTGGNLNTVYQVNSTSKFGILTYTGNESAGQSMNHGLGTTPAVFMIKNRSQGNDWAVYHHKNTAAPETDLLVLNTTAATADVNTFTSDNAPNSTVIYVGAEHNVNANTENYVCYYWAEVQGYSKSGSYTGNGNASGPFVYTGFKPAWLMIKRTDSSEGWHIVDHKRDVNENNARLQAETNGGEDTSEGGLDMLSNGFKIRTTWAGFNADGGTYIYMAFAESPFVSSKGVPTTAR